MTGRSLVQRSSTECGVSECDLETTTRSRPWPTRNVDPQKRKLISDAFGLTVSKFT